MFKRFSAVIIALSLIFGAWGLYMLLANGQQMLGLSNFVPWGLWMSLYVFFASTAAGMFFVASLDLLFKVKRFAGTGKVFMLASFASLIAALVHIFINEGRPERIIHAFIYPNFESVLTWSIIIYTLVAIATAVLLLALFLPQRFLPMRKEPLVKILMIIGLPIAVLASGAVGFTLSTQVSMDFWHIGLFPVLFPIFGLSAGFALSRIMVALFGDKTSPTYPALAKVMIVSTLTLLVANIYIISSWLFVAFYGGTPDNLSAVEYIMGGQHWYAFWFIQIGLGVIVPIIILAMLLWKPALAKKPIWGFSAGLLVILGTAVARLNFIVPAQIAARIDFTTSPFSGDRFTGSYVPSLPEWALSIGITAAVVLFFYVAATKLKLLPMKLRDEEMS